MGRWAYYAILNSSEAVKRICPWRNIFFFHSWLHFIVVFFIKTTIELTCDGSCHLIKNSKRYIQFRENYIFLCKMDNIHTSLTECALVTSSAVTRITVHGISACRSILAWVTGTLVGILKAKKIIWISWKFYRNQWILYSDITYTVFIRSALTICIYIFHEDRLNCRSLSSRLEAVNTLS